jgi:hemoglobin-like flavoprotein
MKEAEIKLVKSSWRLLKSIDPALIGDVFYSKLFMEAPSVRKLFPKDMVGQQVKLIDMLNFIVHNIDNLDKLTNDITAMAIRHEGYGAKPIHYQKVGEALLWTLKKGLGHDWNNETEKAWQACYNLLADTMVRILKVE